LHIGRTSSKIHLNPWLPSSICSACRSIAFGGEFSNKKGMLHPMFFTKFKAFALTGAAGVAALVSFSVLPAEQPKGAARDGAAQAVKLDLTPENFPTIHALVRPHENEWRHLQVRWLTDVVAARQQAAAEDKPIVICYTGGAGYNEPLGVC
jgi:hypothetical protein